MAHVFLPLFFKVAQVCLCNSTSSSSYLSSHSHPSRKNQIPPNSKSMATLGGVHESHASQNSLETEDLARFAVDDHNNKEAKEQVVAGTLHHLTIEAIDAGKKKLYEAKVWVKPWMGFKEVQEFKHADKAPESS